ncbi:MAG TPA: metallophosphoesterase [Clostridia bacterium]|nr:metallophosphoesterase [Clostridia bacterium]
MIYVTANLHGNFEGFVRLLEKINLKEEDTLYVLGNVVDKGKEPIELLMDMSFRTNIMPILGNHDYIAFTVLSQLRDMEDDENPVDRLDAVGLRLFEWWMDNGGRVTLDAFLAGDEDKREGILEYLEEFALYEKVEAGGFSYVLVHAGLKNFTPERTLDKYEISDLLFESPDYSKVYFEDRILVTAHTPTNLIEGGKKGEVYKAHNHRVINLGTNKKIAAVRLDDGEEFFVD